jgi:hypothetical protein
MSKRALCVGINDYPGEANDLNGCVNDARAWADLLAKHYDFPGAAIKILLNAEATKANVLGALKNLLKGAKSGDVLVFTNSSHGTYVADKGGDEKLYDEAMCPYDCQDRLIVDDELRTLFSDLPKGVGLTVISDSCFSGTVTRAAEGPKTPDDRRVRFLNPKWLGHQEIKNIYKAKPRVKEAYPESKMKELLLSGCTDKEYSYDASIGGVYHGAMSYFALKAIREAKYKITAQKLHERLARSIEDAGYPQHPQLEGSSANKSKQIFT